MGWVGLAATTRKPGRRVSFWSRPSPSLLLTLLEPRLLERRGAAGVPLGALQNRLDRRPQPALQRRTEDPALKAKAGHSSMSTTERYVKLAGVVFRSEATAQAARLLGRSPIFYPTHLT
jgi:hypothetical protein